MRLLWPILVLAAVSVPAAPAMAADAPPPPVDLEAIAAQEGPPPLLEQPLAEPPVTEPPAQPQQPAPPQQEEPPADVDVPEEVGQEAGQAEAPFAEGAPQPRAPVVPTVSLPRTGYEALPSAAAGYALLLAGIALARSLWLTRDAGA